MNKVLIVGASGNIGSYLTRSISNKYELTIVSRRHRPELKKHVQLDLTDKKSVEIFSKKNSKFDFLIFLVGLAHKKGKNKDYNEFRLLNYITLKNLLLALSNESKIPNKIIFASTISVYGERMDQKFHYEDDQTNPVSPYAITKLKAEKFLLNNYFSQAYVLRLAPVYFKNFLLNINRRTKISGYNYKVGSGTKKLSLCNMKNILAVICGILNDELPNGIYNVSDDKEYCYNDLLNFVGDKTYIVVPELLIKPFYYFGKATENIYLQENSIKLLSDNIYPSKKINSYLKIKYNLNDV